MSEDRVQSLLRGTQHGHSEQSTHEDLGLRAKDVGSGMRAGALQPCGAARQDKHAGVSGLRLSLPAARPWWLTMSVKLHVRVLVGTSQHLYGTPGQRLILDGWQSLSSCACRFSCAPERVHGAVGQQLILDPQAGHQVLPGLRLCHDQQLRARPASGTQLRRSYGEAAPARCLPCADRGADQSTFPVPAQAASAGPASCMQPRGCHSRRSHAGS